MFFAESSVPNASARAASTISESALPNSRLRRSLSATIASRASRNLAEIIADPSERVSAGFAGAYAHRSVDGNYPHLAVADLAGPRGADDALTDCFDVAILGENLDFHLRHE